MSGNHFVTKRFQKRKYPLYISFPIVPNRLFSGRTKNNQHFGYPGTKITDFKISGNRLGTTLRHCRLILEMEMELGTKSRFHYLCLSPVQMAICQQNVESLLFNKDAQI